MPRLVVKDNINDSKLRNSLELLVDGLVMGHLHPRGETVFSVAAGRHSIRLRIDGKLQIFQYFSIKERETTTFHCEVSGIFRRKFSLKEKGRQRPNDRFGNEIAAVAARSKQSLNGSHSIS